MTIIRVCAGSSDRKTCRRRTRPNRRGISSEKCAAPIKSQSSQTASKSTYLPQVSPSRATFAWRRMATCSSPKAAPGASACCGRAAAARRSPARSHRACTTRSASRSIRPVADPQWVYVGNTDAVVRFPYRNGDRIARGRAEVVVPHLPVGGHSTRDVVFSPDGKTMYVSVGSRSNAGEGLEKLSAAALQAWQSNHPLGAAWGDETERADVLGLRSGRQEPPRLRDRHPQLRRHGGRRGERHAVVLDQRARRPRRRCAARLHHPRARRRLLRLALVLYRRASRIRVTAANGRTSKTRSPSRTC